MRWRRAPISALPCHRCSLLKLIKDRVEVFSSRLSRAEGLPLLSVSGLTFLKSFGKISLIFQITLGIRISGFFWVKFYRNITSSEESFSIIPHRMTRLQRYHAHMISLTFPLFLLSLLLVLNY